MAILNNNPLVGASGNQGGYNINNSLRFRGSASAYLSRTPSSAGNRKTWTWSAWIKLGTISVNMGTLFIAQGQTAIYLNDGTNSSFRVNGAAGSDLITSLMPRDPSAWYHLVVACDTTQATDTNRLKIYVNGVQQTAFQAGSAYPTLNGDTYVNSTAAHYIGRRVWNGDQQYDGYIAEQYLIDGSQKAASDFGETDTTTGVWKPKAYTGTYGTNGFYLKFSDIATTSGSNAGLGKDFSGNSNYWTTNNISVTSGTTYDAMTDSPTNTSATVANYCTLNPLVQRWAVNAGVFSEANLKVTTTGSSSSFGFGTIFNSTGKWYWEGTLTAAGTATPGTGVGDLQCQSGTFTNLIEYNKDGSHTGAGASWATYTTNDVIGVALDCDGGNIYFYKNNTLQGSVALTAGVSYAPLMDVVLNATWAANFGQRPFTYTPPTGYNRLNTFSLPTPTILQGNKYMDATLYTGNGYPTSGTQSITNAASFKPDLVWIKIRSGAGSHTLTDSVRGVNSQLFSNQTAAQETNTDHVTAFNSNGFSLGTGSSGTYPSTNSNGSTYVGWQWQAGQGTTSSNTSGSITSTVSVNTTAGFSIVTYTGTGSTKTFGHGLGVTPAMFIVKSRSQTGENWVTWHKSFSNTAQGNMALNTTDAVSNSASVWGNTAPTSTLITVGNSAVNNNTSTYVCYAWAEIAGFSKFGSYTGNGSADGPFVYTGFRPKYVMIKQSAGTSAGSGNWMIQDTSRNPFNQEKDILAANLSNAEFSDPNYGLDGLSNGFKIRSTNVNWNESSGTYIFMAFAENPFKNALAR